MTKEEREKILGQATTEAIKKHHEEGLTTIHEDGEIIYKIYSDGHKEIVNEFEWESQIKKDERK